MPHRVLERDVKLNLGGTLIVGLWGVSFALAGGAWIADESVRGALIHASMMLGLLGVSLGQVKSHMRQRSMCAARLDLAEVRRTAGDTPVRRVQ